VRDGVLLAVLLLSFAAVVTAHVAIAVRLAVHGRPRYRGLVALVVPPLAPYWAYTVGFRALCWTWVASVTCYAVALTLASVMN
jgi:hypothetical protein